MSVCQFFGRFCITKVINLLTNICICIYILYKIYIFNFLYHIFIFALQVTTNMFFSAVRPFIVASMGSRWIEWRHGFSNAFHTPLPQEKKVDYWMWYELRAEQQCAPPVWRLPHPLHVKDNLQQLPTNNILFAQWSLVDSCECNVFLPYQLSPLVAIKRFRPNTHLFCSHDEFSWNITHLTLNI